MAWRRVGGAQFPQGTSRYVDGAGRWARRCRRQRIAALRRRRGARGTVSAGQTVRHTLGKGRVAYLVAATGSVVVNGVNVGTRDGVTVTDEAEIEIVGVADAEIVLVDVVG